MNWVTGFFRSKEPADDLYIALLRYGKDHLGESTTPKALFKVMNDRGFASPYLSSQQQFALLFSESFEALRTPGASDNSDWVFKGAAYFRLLEYEELNEARSSSKRALYVAIAALVVSGVLALASIYFSIACPCDWP